MSLSQASPRNSSALQASYDRLNPQQRQAVDSLEGPVLVFAGPGTGKTQILTTRIGKLLESGVEPGNILALTFTNSGAKAMQQRLSQLVGASAYQVLLTTFHSFCSRVIEQHPEAFPVELQRGGMLADLDQLELLREVWEPAELPHLKKKPGSLHHLKNCLSLITQYKREGLSPAEVTQQAQEGLEELEATETRKTELKKRQPIFQRNLDVAKVYQAYQDLCRTRGLYDYEDMILWVRDALRSHEDISLEYQERFQYILVDEFQDTNQAQFQILLALSQYWGPQANVFVVGDPNQAIYRFQGASISNVMQFWQLFPDTQVITLEQGYRCPPEIYAAAAQLIQNNTLTDLDERLKALEQPLRSTQPLRVGSSPLQVSTTFNPLTEALQVSSQLQSLHEAGTPWSEMAVLYRSHAQVATLEWVLRRKGLPVVVQRGENSLDQPLVKAVLDLLQLLVELPQGLDLERWASVLMQPWWKFPRQEALQLLRAVARQQDPERKQVWWWLTHEETWTELEWKQQESWREFVQFLSRALSLPSGSLSGHLEWILAEAGIYRSIWADSVWQSQLPFLLALLRTAQQWERQKPESTLAQLLERIAAMQEHGMTLTAEYLATHPDAITLSTAHSAKGREWEHVFLIQVNQTVWSDIKTPARLEPLPNTIPYAQLEKKETLEDDRRLFYVAATRAKHTLWLSICQQDVRSEAIRELLPSQFILEMELTPSLMTAKVTTTQELQQVLQSEGSSFLSSIQPEWVRGLVAEFTLSFTALESYLGCPVDFFFSHLVKMPQQPSAVLVHGNAVHKALQLVNQAVMRGEAIPEMSHLSGAMSRMIQDSGLRSEVSLEVTQSVEEQLRLYLDYKQATWPKPLAVEQSFGYVQPTVFEGLSLGGKIDAILSIDAAAQTVRVVDYKTGARLTRSELEGKPGKKQKKLDQVVFYALLLQLDAISPYKALEGVFEFLTPTEAGKYLPVVFEITSERMESLKNILREVRDDLRSLAFLQRPACGQCQWCQKLGLKPALSPLLTPTREQEVDRLSPSA